MEWNENMHVHECIEEHRISGVVTSLTVSITAYKRDALTMVAGDGNLLGHAKETWKLPTVVGRNYRDYNNSTSLLTKSFTYNVPVSEQTDKVQPATNTMASADWRIYRDKRRAWINSFSDTEDYYNCYDDFWTDLEALNVSW